MMIKINKQKNKQTKKSQHTEEPKPYVEIRTTFKIKMSLFDLDQYPNILPSQNDLALKTNTPTTIQNTFAAS